MQLSWNSAIQSEQSNLILCKQVQCYTIVPVPVQPHVCISKRSVGGWESSERISRLGGKGNQEWAFWEFIAKITTLILKSHVYITISAL